MKRLYVILIAYVIGLYGAPVFARDLTYVTDIEMARKMYERVNNTRPSKVNMKGHVAAIRSRLQCYEDHHDIESRMGVCNSAYTNSIVKLARENIVSKPMLGLFVLNVRMCPIMYNICIGKSEQDVARCITFERQCIDHILDIYWRGSRSLGYQTYWSEQ